MDATFSSSPLQSPTMSPSPSLSSIPSTTNSPYLLEIKTVQSSTFKQVVDALKEILMDVNLEFDETGMKIVALDNTRVVLVHLKLDADKFENYFCEKKLYVVLTYWNYMFL